MVSLFNLDNDDKISPAEVPLSVRMRPKKISDFVGQKHLLNPGSALYRLICAKDEHLISGPTSVILWGPAGTGKTTLAYLIAQEKKHKFVELSAITANVKDVRNVLDIALQNKELYGKTTVLFLDEIHRFTKSQQDVLLPAVENRWIVLVAATTENPSFSIITPLISRSLVLALKPLSAEELKSLLLKAVQDVAGLANKVHLETKALNTLIRLVGGDARRALIALEAAASIVWDRFLLENSDKKLDFSKKVLEITVEDVSEALDSAVVSYDRAGDSHYDVVSAFIKSIRGSDVDAALHYLARMLEAGEDPRFIARRLIISAAEDIGMADPTALQSAVAAAQAIALIGMPEGRIVLAQVVVHLSTAPKSNASYKAINFAIEDVRNGALDAVPLALRDSHYSNAANLGHGVGYKYSHDEPHAVAKQQYAPDGLVNKNYYYPTSYGAEKNIALRVARLREMIRKK